MDSEFVMKKRRKVAAVGGAIAASVAGIAMTMVETDYIPREPYFNRDNQRDLYLDGIINSVPDCHHTLRMNKEAFVKLVAMCRDKKLLVDTRNVEIEEQVAEFLHTVGHNIKNRVINHTFMRSGETISRYFHTVLKAVLSLQYDLMKQPTSDDLTPPKIQNNQRFSPWFKANSYARDLLNTPLDDFEDLRLVCGEDLATGSHAKSNSDIKFETVVHEEATSESQDVAQPTSSEAPKESRGKRTRQSYMEETLAVVGGLSKQVALLTEAVGSDQEFVSRVFDEVMNMDGFSEQVLNKAFEHLTERPLVGRQFIARRPHMRVEWLKDFASKLN